MKGEVYLYHCKVITGMMVSVDEVEVYLYHCKAITGMTVAVEGRGVPVPLQSNNEDDGFS